VFAGEVPRGAAWLIIGDQIDAALTPQMHVFGAVLGHQSETHGLEHRLQRALFRRTKLDEFEPIEARWILEQIAGMESFMRGFV